MPQWPPLRRPRPGPRPRSHRVPLPGHRRGLQLQALRTVGGMRTAHLHAPWTKNAMDHAPVASPLAALLTSPTSSSTLLAVRMRWLGDAALRGAADAATSNHSLRRGSLTPHRSNAALRQRDD
eukprot:6230171-Prymnesium_polylepis.2